MSLKVMMKHFNGTEIEQFNGAIIINSQLNYLKDDQFNGMLF